MKHPDENCSCVLLINQTLGQLGDNEVELGRYSGNEFWIGGRKVTKYVVDYKRIDEIFDMEIGSTHIL